MKRFLICLPWLKVGDFLLITPVLAAIRKQSPDAYIALLIRTPVPEDWAGQYPLVDNVISCRPAAASRWRGFWQAVRDVKAGRFDVAIYRGISGDVPWVIWLAGIPVRIAGPYRHFRFLLTHAVGNVRTGGDRHEVEYNLELIRPLGIPVPDSSVYYPVSVEDQLEADSLLEARGVEAGDLLIAMNGGNGGSARLWPGDRFVQVANCFIERYGARIIIVGKNNRPHPWIKLPVETQANYIDLDGKTSLRQLAAVLKRCHLYVGMESGTGHMAAAVHTPCVAIFSDGGSWDQHVRWRPWQVEQRILGPISRCRNCAGRCDRRGTDCIASITVEQVLHAACEFLDPTWPQGRSSAS